MTQLFKNNATSVLAAPASDLALSIQVPLGKGALFPSPTGSDFFLLTITNATTETLWEVVKVTANSSDIFTIVRAQEGTTARAWLQGDKVELRLTAGFIGSLDTPTNATTATVASATTTNIAAANAANVTVSGTTTITAFDSASVGVRRTVTFSGALTLTHNASTLVLPGGVNITTVAGDVGEFVATATGWKCLDYTPITVTGTGGQVRSNTPTLTTPVINGFTGDTSAINIGSGQVIKDASGNLALNTTNPSASTTKHLLQVNGGVIGFGGAAGNFSSNAYYNSGWKYKTSAAATNYLQQAGTHTLQYAASGTADGAITWVNALAIDASGNITYQSTGSALNNVASINSGQLAGFRNKVINGDMRVAQRAAPTLTTAAQYGQVDRVKGYIQGGTGISGTFGQWSGLSGYSGYLCGALAASWTSGKMVWQYMIESKDTIPLAGKTVTLSFKVYQDTGGTRSFNVTLAKGNGVDIFTVPAGLSTTSFSANTGNLTSYSVTVTLGANDAANGLYIDVYDNAANTVSGKYYLLTELQLEVGSVATPFEQRPIATEWALCERYKRRRGVFVAGLTATSGYKHVSTDLTGMRATPTVTIYDLGGNLGKITTVDTSGVQTNNVTPNAYAPTASMGTITAYAYITPSTVNGIAVTFDGEAEL